MEKLNLNNCDQIKTGCLEYAFQKLTNLSELRYCFIYSRLQTQGTLSNALSYLNQLRELYLVSNCRVNDETLKSIGKACLSLQVLDLSSCYKVTDYGLFHLSHFNRLNQLHLSCCEITDVGVKTLTKLDRLERLDLCQCEDVTDASVTELLKCCINLKGLVLNVCPKITNATVLACYDNIENKSTFLALYVVNTSVCLEEILVTHPMLKIFS